MARKRRFFSSEKAVRELGYRRLAAAKAFEDAVLWLREQELPGYFILVAWQGHG